MSLFRRLPEDTFVAVIIGSVVLADFLAVWALGAK